MQNDINSALEVLKKGGIILYPTDTIWGIGCDATNVEAVKRVYEIKKRCDSKSMLVLLDSANKIPSYIDEMPDVAWDLIDMAESPLTIIYDGAKNLASNLIAEDGSVGIRVAKDEFCEKLIQRFRKPIVSTSANISGDPSPSNFLDISEEIKELVDFVVEHKQAEMANPKPSSIIKLGRGGEIKILRE